MGLQELTSPLADLLGLAGDGKELAGLLVAEVKAVDQVGDVDLAAQAVEFGVRHRSHIGARH